MVASLFRAFLGAEKYAFLSVDVLYHLMRMHLLFRPMCTIRRRNRPFKLISSVRRNFMRKLRDHTLIT